MSVAILAMAAAYTVTTPAQLNAAVARAKSDDTIIVAPGDYGMVQFGNAQFDKPVTIRSQDPKRPASFSRFWLKDPRNLILENLEFTRGRGSEPSWAKIVEISGGSDVTIKGGSVHGTLNGSPADDMNGVYFRGTRRMTVTGVTFRELNVALTFDDSADVVIDSNSFSYLGTDSINLAAVNGAKVVNNHFYDFRPVPGAHPDAIQCWTRSKTTACKNVTIHHNNFDGAPGHEFQGVFFGDEAKIGGYDNIEISDNVFTSTMWHAIYIGPGSNIVIKNNVITAGPTMKPWIRTESPATLVGNSAPTYVIGGVQKPPKGNKVGGLYKK